MKDALPKTINQRPANTNINTYWSSLTVLVGRIFKDIYIQLLVCVSAQNMITPSFNTICWIQHAIHDPQWMHLNGFGSL